MYYIVRNVDNKILKITIGEFIANVPPDTKTLIWYIENE